MIKVKNVQMVSVHDLDALVRETYGRHYTFQQQDGCKERGSCRITVPCDVGCDVYENDTVPEEINGEEMGVSFAAWLARDPTEWNGSDEDRRFLDLFWSRNFYPDVQMVVNDLHAKGLFPAGEFVIEIDW